MRPHGYSTMKKVTERNGNGGPRKLTMHSQNYQRSRGATIMTLSTNTLTSVICAKASESTATILIFKPLFNANSLSVADPTHIQNPKKLKTFGAATAMA